MKSSKDRVTIQLPSFKGQMPPRNSLSRGGFDDPGRSRWEGAPGDTLTLVGAYRDTLRVVRSEHGAKSDELRQTLEEIEILPSKIDKLWHNGWRGYAPLVMTTRRSFHTPKSLSLMRASTLTKSNVSGH
jgi:hypothetical protein